MTLTLPGRALSMQVTSARNSLPAHPQVDALARALPFKVVRAQRYSRRPRDYYTLTLLADIVAFVYAALTYRSASGWVPVRCAHSVPFQHHFMKEPKGTISHTHACTRAHAHLRAPTRMHTYIQAMLQHILCNTGTSTCMYTPTHTRP